MKRFNKHILEAINRGIQLALDDYDNNFNEVIIPKKETIKNNNSVKDLIRIHKKFIDLGLPSGTLWAKYNLGYDPSYFDVFTNPIYGKQYSWGEIEPKKEYNQENYLFSNGESAFDKILYKKYVTEEKFAFNGNIDNILELQLEDDIAYLTDHELRIPSHEQLDELVKYTDQIYDDNGIIFKSKINDEELFIPYNQSNKFNKYCQLWSRTLYIKKCDGAWALETSKAEQNLKVKNLFRFYGFPIRPVYNDRN